MAQKAEIRLGDELVLGDITAEWTLITGVLPFQKTFNFSTEESTGKPESAERLLEKGNQAIKLVIDPDGEKVVYERLFILGEEATRVPYLKGIVVSDVRWCWPRVHVLKRYNVRRRTGNRRIVTEDVLGNVVVNDDVGYHTGTLNPPFSSGGVRWTGREIMIDLLSYISSRLPAPYSFDFVVDDDVDSNAAVENFEVDATAPAAIQRALKFLPGADITVDPDGTVRVFNTLNKSEGKIIKDLGPEYVDSGHIIYNTEKITRPQFVRVWFTRECELRFDFDEEPTGTANPQARAEQRSLDNVLPFPDIDNETYARGTWVDMNTAFSQFGTNAFIGGPMTHDFIHKHWMIPNFMQSVAETAGTLDSISGDDQDWIIRMAEIKKHYRQTYRIRREWMDRIISLRAYRAAILDTENGTRGPAEAFQDYALLTSRRGLIRTRGLLATNIIGYNDNIADGKISPVTVNILDEDQGIVRLDFALDPIGYTEKAIPSALDNIPSADPAQATNPRFWAEARGGNIVAKLRAQHKMALVLTAIPATPNSTQQLHSVVVNINDAKQALPSLSATGADGPPIDVRIPPNIQTARFAWKDDSAASIEAAFGLRERDPDQLSQEMESLLVNGDEIKELAVASAAAVYSRFEDKFEGQASFGHKGAVKLQGGMSSLRTRGEPDGQLATEVRLRKDRLPLDPLARLPEGVQQVVLRTVK